MTTATPTGTSQRLTYPISPEYYKGWNSERAISELVANAIDEDPKFSFSWKDGVLTIKDNATGIGDNGLLLGMSRKTDQQIGQFGEGLQAACLVLSRDPAIGKMYVETVGYSFEPLIVRERLVTIGKEEGGQLPEMLALDIVANKRKKGTYITVECPKKLADKVKARFLHFQPGYKPAPPTGRVLDGKGGSIYIGGVLVASGRRLLFSYDFSLTVKDAQNRDRSVIDGYVMDRMIRAALDNMDDEQKLEKWVRAGLSGKLAQAEQSFYSYGAGPNRLNMMKKLRSKIYGDGKLCYGSYHDSPEALLYCKDRDYNVLTNPGIEVHSFDNIMKMMSVPAAGSLYKEPKEHVTIWTKRKDLSKDEIALFDECVNLVKTVHGPESIGRCDVYETTQLIGADGHLGWGGFYDPKTTRIGIQRRNLSDRHFLLRILAHEAAHRRRHLTHKHDWQDNTRGFEQELDSMLGDALMLIQEHGLADALAKRLEEKQVALDAENERKARQLLEHEQTHPAPLARKLFNQAMKKHGFAKPGQLKDVTSVPAIPISYMMKGRKKNGRWEPCAQNLDRTKAVCNTLGLEWSIIHLAFLTENGIHGLDKTTWGGSEHWVTYSRRGSKRYIHGLTAHSEPRQKAQAGTGRIMGTRGTEIQKCIDRLVEIGVEPVITDLLQSQLDHAFDFTDPAWADPYTVLLESNLVHTENANLV